MSKVDQFESAFRSATKEVFHYRPFAVASVLVVTDLADDAARDFTAVVESFLAALRKNPDLSYVTISGDRFKSPRDLLDLVEKQRPDLIITYRCLHSKAWQWVFTLGAHVDVLTQATTTPVLLMPHPELHEDEVPNGSRKTLGATDRVMAVTDHLAGDERLVNAALTFVEGRACLYLSHVEDESTFERYITAIGKIPEIDTELARNRIQEQLLKEPADYIRSVTEALRRADLSCEIQELVSMGRHVTQYRELVDSHKIDLLVINTKDDYHSAMHGLAYPLAVELRDTPLLML